MQITIIYTYELLSNSYDLFQAIQKESEQLYRKHLNFTTNYFQDINNPNLWIEIQTFTDEKSYQLAENILFLEPQLRVLYEKFLQLLKDKKALKMQKVIKKDVLY